VKAWESRFLDDYSAKPAKNHGKDGAQGPLSVKISAFAVQASKYALLKGKHYAVV
jgi:hypothetical protein